MKILMVLPNLSVGGSQRQTINLAKGLAAKGLEVTLLVFERGGRMQKQVPPEVELVFSEYRPVSPIKFLLNTFSILKAIKKIRPQMIYTRLNHAESTLAGKIAGIPTIISYVDNSHMMIKKHGPLKKFLAVFKQKLSLKLASIIMANSRGLAEECENHFNPKSKVTMIYNGTDLDFIKEKSLESASHKWIGGGAPLCISVGRLDKKKGFETLIDAFSILKGKTNARLLIVGDGSLKKSLSDKIKRLGLENSVSLAGEKMNPYPFISAADLYVQSSVYEGFSNAMMEAAALGKPVISTDHRFGANEIVENGENGLLTPVGDAQAMAEAIEKVLQDEEILRTMGKYSAKKAENFSLEKIVSKHEELFSNLVSSVFPRGKL